MRHPWSRSRCTTMTRGRSLPIVRRFVGERRMAWHHRPRLRRRLSGPRRAYRRGPFVQGGVPEAPVRLPIELGQGADVGATAVRIGGIPQTRGTDRAVDHARRIGSPRSVESGARPRTGFGRVMAVVRHVGLLRAWRVLSIVAPHEDLRDRSGAVRVTTAVQAQPGLPRHGGARRRASTGGRPGVPPGYCGAMDPAS